MTGRPVRLVTGSALVLRGDDIDTDRIIPARFVKTSPYAELGRHVFADDRAAERAAGRVHAFDDPAYAAATVLLVGENFGCGSSREHAVAALTGWGRGIAAVVGRSFSNIFAANALANGVPCVSVGARDAEALMRHVESRPDGELAVDVAAGVVRVADPDREVPFETGPGFRERLLSGSWDPMDRLLGNAERTEQVAAALPYHSWPHPLVANPPARVRDHDTSSASTG